ncbi:hypothetical protein [Pseudomonas sp. MWU12-2323]|uniref:hypothetical protein n=1 Tax=Pseudomonas sp. MWU12-2323 TaxID=2651296 RepID=UPI00128BC970|nr:hypothetical protein [Pseudomonas sp. MWU12-2323]MPQ69253.1 hypothetical protein [Pseudomonas sp. MWU12-2323]
MIQLDDQFLYSELPVEQIHDLLADVVARYESFFTFCEPKYPDGVPELLFKVLSDGYGFATCSNPLKIEVVDLRAVRVVGSPHPGQQWKDVFAGRILAATFASTINCS